MSHKLVNDAVFYIGGFLDPDELVPARFVNKQWKESLGRIRRKKHHVKLFLRSIRLYEWAREALGMPEAGREDMLKSGCLELVVQRWAELEGPGELIKYGAWNACRAAAEGGNLHVLQWLRAQDPPCLEYSDDENEGA